MTAQSSLTHPPAVSTEPALLTGSDVLRMGDIGPYELIKGRLVPMSPTKPEHGRLESRLDRILGRFVDEHSLGEVWVGEVGLYTHRNPDTVRGVDLLFISHERRARATPGNFLDVAPELVIEILSPQDRWSEVRKKLREYFAIGVTVVLVADLDEQTISVYRSLTDIQELAVGDVLEIADVLPGFSVSVADLFAPGK